MREWCSDRMERKSGVKVGQAGTETRRTHQHVMSHWR